MTKEEKCVSFDKRFFATREVVESLLRNFVPEEHAQEGLDFPTLECCTYSADDEPQGNDIRIWRIGRKNASPLYLAFVEVQQIPESMQLLRLLIQTIRVLLTIASEEESQGNGVPAIFPIVVCNGERPWKEPLDATTMYGPQKILFLLDWCMDSPLLPKERRWLIGMLLHLRDARDIEIAYKATEEGMHFIENQPPSLETLIVEFTKIKMQNMGITEDLSAVRTMEDMHKFLEDLVACEKKLSSQGEKIGRHRGIEKGVRQGLSQGKLQASRETLLDLLEDRFGSLPKSVSSHVEKEKDAQKLHRLILSVYRVGSLDAFVGKLGPMEKTSARTC